MAGCYVGAPTGEGTLRAAEPLAWHDTHGMPTRRAKTAEVRRVVVVSYRLGGGDGVSTEAAKWERALERLGCTVSSLAGEGRATFLEPGLAAGEAVTGRPAPPPDETFIAKVLDGADLVVVENLCSLPLNPAAGAAVARCLAGRPALFRHHDLPWQRPAWAAWGPPPDDPAWAHVVINDHSRHELAARGIDAVTVRNAFEPFPSPGDRDGTRRALGVGADRPLVVQPTRAIARKNVPQALALAEALDAFYWLVGGAEEGYGPVVEAVLGAARVPVYWGLLEGFVTSSGGIEHAYAAADLVAFPSTQEGFGNPPVEASLHRRMAVVGDYQAAGELRGMGFSWLAQAEPGQAASFLNRARAGDPEVMDVIDRNAALARRYLSLDDLPARLAAIIERKWGLRPPAHRPRALPGAPSADGRALSQLGQDGFS